MCLALRNNSQDYRRPHFLVFTILLLYVLTTVNICHSWVDDIFTFITAGESFWTEYRVTPSASMLLLTRGVGAALSTGLADATLARDLILVFAQDPAYEFLDMALLDCLGSVMVHCACSDCLHLLGNRHVFEFIKSMIYDLSALI